MTPIACGKTRRRFGRLIDSISGAIARRIEKSRLLLPLLRLLRFPGKYRIVIHLRPEELSRVVAQYRGLRYRFDLRDRIERMTYFRLYEDGDLRKILNLIPQNGVCVDVGANSGFYSLEFARRVGQEGIVHAFEPDPAVFERLSDNIDLNGFRGTAKAHMLAVSNRCGRVKFYQSDRTESAWGSVVKFDDIAVREIDVEAITLDVFVRLQCLKRVDFLKIDVEASEFEVLEGADESIKNQLYKYILIEFNGPRLEAQGRTLEAFLERLGVHHYKPVVMNLQVLEGMRAGAIEARRQCVNLLFERERNRNV